MEDLTPKNSPSLDPIRKPCPVCGGSSYNPLVAAAVQDAIVKLNQYRD